ncbi:MAG: radical SAM family heme chaperone HemW, partial [Kofleriaceae bacterium]|nr:radical SAM family heme chaperone HemW [Kofleriaceae bacterium]
MASDLGVYIHFPWCRKLCPYCDFAVMVAHHEPPHEAYRDAVVAELAARAAAVEGRRLRSIYLGGGTPGLWRPDCVGDVVAAVLAAAAAPGPDALEITIEVNPTDVTAARLAAWRDAGVNRVSIGVQSFDAAELAALGRDHWAGDGPRAVELALAAGLRSVSADLIAGTPAGLVAAPSSSPPSSSVAAARGAPAASIAALIATGVPHASVYELTIEPRTRFGKLARRGALVPRPDDELAALYEANHRALEAAGLEHYEISSYARPGHRAVHNSLYWSGAEYLGLGAGAASFERRA